MAEFHEELKKIREDRGISHNEIIDKIKIRTDFLARLEDGDLTFVPMPFVRGFIQEYAKVVGIDPVMALQRLDNKIPTLLTDENMPKEKSKPKRSTKKKKVKSAGFHTDESPEISEADKNAGETPADEPGPQTSLFEEPSENAEPEDEPQASDAETQGTDKDETAVEAEESSETEEPAEDMDSSEEEKSTEDKASTEDEESTEDENPAEDEQSAEDEELPKEEDTQAAASETAPESEDEPETSVVPLEEETEPGKLEPREPLDIKEAESPGNVAFFIFIAIMIILAAVILIMNRGSLF